MRLFFLFFIFFYKNTSHALECKIINTNVDPSEISCLLGGKYINTFISRELLFPIYHNKTDPNIEIGSLSEYTSLFLEKELKTLVNGCKHSGESMIRKFKGKDLYVCATPAKCIVNGLMHDQIAVCTSKTSKCPAITDCMEDKSLTIRDAPKPGKPSKKKSKSSGDTKGSGH
jgi:hypothetical protein